MNTSAIEATQRGRHTHWQILLAGLVMSTFIFLGGLYSTTVHALVETRPASTADIPQTVRYIGRLGGSYEDIGSACMEDSSVQPGGGFLFAGAVAGSNTCSKTRIGSISIGAPPGDTLVGSILVGIRYSCPVGYGQQYETLGSANVICRPTFPCPPDADRPWTFVAETKMCERTVAEACTLSHASGSPCVCDSGYEWDVGHTQCIPEETYTLTLTPDKATIEPNQSTTFTATVTKNPSGTPSKPIPVSVGVKVDATSGGHDHGEAVAPRPKGTLSTTSGNTSFPITFTATDVSGKHTITATCDLCENKTESVEVTVKVDGLLEIPASTFYVLGSSSRHGTKNHYLLPAAAEKLLLLAINYQSQGLFKVMNPNTNTMVWPEPFRVNDASLEWGGRFDIYGDWTKPHKEHIRGVSVDLRANEGMPNAIPPENFLKFDELLSNTLMPDGIGEVSFLECTKDKKDKKGAPATPKHRRIPENFCVSQLDGSFDTNRHYHVRLMGVAK